MATKSKKTAINRQRVRLFDEQAAERVLKIVDDHIADGRFEEAMQALDSAPARLQRLPEFSYARGQVMLLTNRYHDGIAELEDTIQKAPDFIKAYFSLMLAYTVLEYWSHVRLYAEKILRRKIEDPKMIAAARELLERAQAELSRKAIQVSAPLDKFVTASFYNESAQLHLHRDELKQSLHESEKAIRSIPGWASPRNNHAIILFFSGQIEKAIAESQQILSEIDPNNTHALGNLILFHLCRWEPEQAASYTNRLSSFLRSSPLEGIDLIKAVECLGIAEEDDLLWEFAQRVQKLSLSILPGESWYILGAAAANTGHLLEARKLLNRAQKNILRHQQWLEMARKAVQKAIREKKPIAAPSLTGRLPYIQFLQLLSGSASQSLYDILLNDYDEEERMAKLEDLVRRYPSAGYAGKLILWNEDDQSVRHIGIQLMAVSGQDGAYQEIRRFASSQYGSDAERMYALGLLQLVGQIKADDIIKMWSQEKQEWHDVQFRLNKIEPAYRSPCNPRADKLVDQASKLVIGGHVDRQKLIQAEDLLRKAVAIDPKCAIAIHNLGSIIGRLGNLDEAEVLIRQSIEIDPNYLYGYTSLAEIAWQRDDHDTCQYYLDKVIKAPSVPANAIGRALYIQTNVLIAKSDYERAKDSFDMLKALLPDYPGIDYLEMYIRLANFPTEWQDRWTQDRHRYRERQLDLAIAPSDALKTLLNRNSAEALGYTLRFWGLPPRGRKADIIQRLVDFLLDPEKLAWRFEDLFDEQQKKALTWILEGGGVRAWQDFTDRFGSDYDESPYWQYHDPKTVPGVLRGSGLCYVGTLKGERVILIPAELRSSLSAVI